MAEFYRFMFLFHSKSVHNFHVAPQKLCVHSLEVPCQGTSDEYLQHMFSWRNKTKILIRILLYNRVFNCFKQHVYYVSINSFIYYVSKNNFLEQNIYNNMMFTSLILD